MEIKPKFAVRAHGHWGREAPPHCNRDGWRGQGSAKSSTPRLAIATGCNQERGGYEPSTA